MSLKDGLAWYRTHYWWVLLASVSIALFGPAPSHEAGITFKLPVGVLILFVESPSAFRIVASLIVIYSIVASVVLTVVVVAWASLTRVSKHQ